MKTIFLVCRSEAETAKQLVRMMKSLFPECEVQVIQEPVSMALEESKASRSLS
jgi:hypothetical protein